MKGRRRFSKEFKTRGVMTFIFKSVIMAALLMAIILLSLTAGASNEKIVFLGDSLTAEADWNALFPNGNIVNHGIGGDTTIDIYNRLGYVIKDAPKRIFIMAGINDIFMGRPIEELIQTYNKIISVLITRLPNVEIYVMSILPVNFEFRGDFHNSYINSVIITTNERIKQAVNKYKRDKVKFLDIHGTFTENRTSKLNPMFTDDGVHLTPQGYLNWKQQIKPYVY
ncbi:MAG: hypothetical protein HQK99_11900 [Nitrospirae bacterium]|nr:hypothetical protein [Nitrospirota bacterium]